MPPINATPQPDYLNHYFSVDDAIVLHVLRQLEDGKARQIMAIQFDPPPFYRSSEDFLLRMEHERLIGRNVVPKATWSISKAGLELLALYDGSRTGANR